MAILTYQLLIVTLLNRFFHNFHEEGMKTQLQTGDRQPNLILSSANDKLMERVEILKDQAISARKQQVQKEYQELLGVLAKRWFLINDLSSLPPEELQALEFLVYEKAKRSSRIWWAFIFSVLSLPIISFVLGDTYTAALIAPVAFMFMIFIAISYVETFGKDVPQFLAIKKELERKPKEQKNRGVS